MWRYGVVASVLIACGSDDGDGGDGTLEGGTEPCEVTVSGDASGAESCRMFLCYPRESDNHSLAIATPLAASSFDFHLGVDVAAPVAIAPGTLTLDQMKSSTPLSVTIGGKTYAARQMPTIGTRNAAETASLVTRAVHPPDTDNVCNGYIDATLTASLVEIMNLYSSSETVGPGRLTLTVELGR